MPFEYRIDPEAGVAWVRATGEDTLAGIRAFSVTIAGVLVAEPRLPPTAPVVIDARGYRMSLVRWELEDLVSVHGLPGLRGRRVAVLTDPGLVFGLARMLSAFAEFRGHMFRPFTSRPEAVDWALQTRSGG